MSRSKIRSMMKHKIQKRINAKSIKQKRSKRQTMKAAGDEAENCKRSIHPLTIC